MDDNPEDHDLTILQKNKFKTCYQYWEKDTAKETM